MNEQEVLSHMRKEQDKKSSMGIYTPHDCKPSDLNIEPLMILHAPLIVHQLGIIYGWLWSRGILEQINDSYDRERLFNEGGAISELAIAVMFRSLYVTPVDWSGLFNFDKYDFIREGKKGITKRVTIGVTSSRQGNMETYTARQAVGMKSEGNPAIHYDYGKINRLPNYLIGVSVKTVPNAEHPEGSDVAIWGAIKKRRLDALMRELKEKGFYWGKGNSVYLPLRVNEIGLEGFNHQDFARLLTALGCNEDLQSIEAKTNKNLEAIADRTKGYH